MGKVLSISLYDSSVMANDATATSKQDASCLSVLGLSLILVQRDKDLEFNSFHDVISVHVVKPHYN